MIKNKGTIIASIRNDLVIDRRNFIEEAETNPESKEIGDFFQTMITHDSESDTYPFEGMERLCSYRRINAFKYTREGTVELSVKSEMSGDGILWLSASVIDTGIGIRPENMESLFTDYTKMDAMANRKIEGTGLGLPITKKMTEMMGGSISVESEFGKGSVFTAKLPQKIVNGAPIGSEIVNNLKNFHYSDSKRDLSLRLARASLPYAKVLVVDDIATNLDVARGMMKPYDMQIDCVTSGQEAIDAVRGEQVRYDAIFMDHMMPEMSGIEATRIIREEIGTEYAKTVPIIALTANAIIGNDEMFLKHGFQDFVFKPIGIQRLDAVIKRWVRNRDLEKAFAAQQPGDKRSGKDRRSGADRRSGYDRRIFAEKITGVNIHKGLSRFSGDMKTYVEILRSFTSNTRLLVETLRDVSEAGLENYTINVHGMKSSCRGIGAEAAGSMAEALEQAGKRGDLDFIAVNNPALLETVAKLITDIENALATVADNSAKDDKPQKDRPDAETLSKLLAACKNYKADDIDAFMEEIERFEYESDDGLAKWLRENVDQMNYSEIAERLEQN